MGKKKKRVDRAVILAGGYCKTCSGLGEVRAGLFNAKPKPCKKCNGTGRTR